MANRTETATDKLQVGDRARLLKGAPNPIGQAATKPTTMIPEEALGPGSGASFTQVTVPGSAVQLDGAVLLGRRRRIRVRNAGSAPVFIGPDADVTAGSGYPIPAGAVEDFLLCDSFEVWAISGGGNVLVGVYQDRYT